MIFEATLEMGLGAADSADDDASTVAFGTRFALNLAAA